MCCVGSHGASDLGVVEQGHIDGQAAIGDGAAQLGQLGAPLFTGFAASPVEQLEQLRVAGLRKKLADLLGSTGCGLGQLGTCTVDAEKHRLRTDFRCSLDSGCMIDRTLGDIAGQFSHRYTGSGIDGLTCACTIEDEALLQRHRP